MMSDICKHLFNVGIVAAKATASVASEVVKGARDAINESQDEIASIKNDMHTIKAIITHTEHEEDNESFKFNY